MKTLEELNAKLAEARDEQARLWADYKLKEATREKTVDPVEVAKLAWHAAYQEQEKIALAIKLLTE